MHQPDTIFRKVFGLSDGKYTCILPGFVDSVEVLRALQRCKSATKWFHCWRDNGSIHSIVKGKLWRMRDDFYG